MGLIRAATGAVGGMLADQWREFFYVEALPQTVLMAKALKRTTGRSANRKGNDNIISNGSIIAVADGQCAIIVEQGRVVELVAEPGEFVWDSSTEPSIFYGSLGANIKNSFQTIGRRIGFGGDTAKDQRVYYINTKELLENKFGTPNPIPFRVVDRNIGLDIDTAIRCSGVYSYRIADPILFYTNVAGNVVDDYQRATLDTTLKTEFVSALQPVFAQISTQEIRPSAIPAHAQEIAQLMDNELSEKWKNLRGFDVVSVALNPITLPPEDAEMIKQLQRQAVLRDPGMAAASLVGAQSDAMIAAGSNPGGAMMGFMGLCMAQQAGGMNAQQLFEMQAQQQAQQQQMAQQQAQPQQFAGPQAGGHAQAGPAGQAGPARSTGSAAGPGAGDTWTCQCGKADNYGNFCTNCGAPKPAPVAAETWTCQCGKADNYGNFCTNCGAPKPAPVALAPTCPQCGQQASSPDARFCTTCGHQLGGQAPTTPPAHS